MQLRVAQLVLAWPAAAHPSHLSPGPAPPPQRKPSPPLPRLPLRPPQVTKTIWGAFPVSQDRVCITLDNQIVFNDLNKDMAVRLG